MTIEGPDGKRYLVYRDGTPVLPLPEGEVLRLADLDPASADIVQALIRARKHADQERAELDPEVYAAVIQMRTRSRCRSEAEARGQQTARGLPWISDREILVKAGAHERR